MPWPGPPIVKPSFREVMTELFRSGSKALSQKSEGRQKYEPMILFNQIVEIFHLPQFNPLEEQFGCFAFGHRFRRGCIFIISDDTRGWVALEGMFAASCIEWSGEAAQAEDRNALRRNSRVFPSESIARYRYIRTFFTLIDVSSTFQESLQAFR
jgi:hypothetical protein